MFLKLEIAVKLPHGKVAITKDSETTIVRLIASIGSSHCNCRELINMHRIVLRSPKLYRWKKRIDEFDLILIRKKYFLLKLNSFFIRVQFERRSKFHFIDKTDVWYYFSLETFWKSIKCIMDDITKRKEYMYTGSIVNDRSHFSNVHRAL